jgi:predicted glycogen debranching enzyme
VTRASPLLPVCEVPCRHDMSPAHDSGVPDLARREWLVTNGIGGFASGTVADDTTRRYHGLLVAALPNPLGRVVMLTALAENLEVPRMRDFRLVGGIPTWRFESGGVEVEKRIVMPHRQNTVVVQYRLVAGEDFRLRLTPVVDFRNFEEPISEAVREDYQFFEDADGFALVGNGMPPLRFLLEGVYSFVVDRTRRERVLYAMEAARGYPAHGALWSPGTFECELAPDQAVSLSASTEDLEVARALRADEAFAAEAARKRRLLAAAPPSLQDGHAAQLVLAADQFVIRPVGRQHDAVRADALGEEVRTIIAGYHWFTDWGRDTMISLEGLTLATGRHREAGFILRTFAHYVRDGLIPNLFPDGSDEGLYHTADATLWFFNALHRFAQVTGSWALVDEVLPVMRGIAEAHLGGTRFGIGVDDDGLLRQGADGYQLTWMDAKVDDWVVTPRRGKAVEINALWYNALRLLSSWEREIGDAGRADRYEKAADRAGAAFNSRFWYSEGGYLYDVVDGPDGDDPACRPNQVLAVALPHPVLDASRWEAVLDVVESKLLTPVGLRSLAPDHPDYKPTYHGDLRTRDAAYHQGTVWAWLIGPWVDAWLRVHPGNHAGARRFLDGLLAHLPDFGVGSIAEIFDAEAPYTPRGCIAQAWSVAELLRCLARTTDGG